MTLYKLKILEQKQITSETTIILFFQPILVKLVPHYGTSQVVQFNLSVPLTLPQPTAIVQVHLLLLPAVVIAAVAVEAILEAPQLVVEAVEEITPRVHPPSRKTSLLLPPHCLQLLDHQVRKLQQPQFQ